ncbi:MAG TPA: hypothetical protein VGG85_11570 [Terracidiphilus sp.]
MREAPPAIASKTVLEQLERMLKSRHFRNSKRYPAFLAHIVRRRLEGDLDSLKERILGIEVFNRAHDYDTAADPVVRITAGEVRKRIALYYHDEGTAQDLRIELPAGSYVPMFVPVIPPPAPVEFVPAAAEAAAEPITLATVGGAATGSTARPRSTVWMAAVGVFAILLLAIAGFWYWIWSTSPIQSMWHPFFGSPDPVLVVVGSPLGSSAPAADNVQKVMDSHSHVHLSLNDALALTDATGLLELHQEPYRVQTSATSSLDDLRKRPVILIAAFGNSWSGRILGPLRFALLRQQVATDGSTILGSIIDHRHPGTMWSFDFTKPMSVNTRDYAVVARLRSDLTEGPVMVIAGLGAGATESAAEFVCSTEYLRQIRAVGPSNWRKKNLELVLEVPVIDGKAGHAHIVASEFW